MKRWLMGLAVVVLCGLVVAYMPGVHRAAAQPQDNDEVFDLAPVEEEDQTDGGGGGMLSTLEFVEWSQEYTNPLSNDRDLQTKIRWTENSSNKTIRLCSGERDLVICAIVDDEHDPDTYDTFMQDNSSTATAGLITSNNAVATCTQWESAYMCYNTLEIKYKYDSTYSSLVHVDMSTYIEQVSTAASWGSVIQVDEGSEHYEIVLSAFSWRINGHATNGVDASSGNWKLQYLSAVSPDTWVDCDNGTLKACASRYGEGWLHEAPLMDESLTIGAVLWKPLRLYSDHYHLRVVLKDQSGTIKWTGTAWEWYD